MQKYIVSFTVSMILALSACTSSITSLSGIPGIGMGTHYDKTKQILLEQNFTIIEDKDLGTGYWSLQAEGSSAGGNWAKFWPYDCQRVGFLFPNGGHVAQQDLKVDVFQQEPCAKDRLNNAQNKKTSITNSISH